MFRAIPGVKPSPFLLFGRNEPLMRPQYYCPSRPICSAHGFPKVQASSGVRPPSRKRLSREGKEGGPPVFRQMTRRGGAAVLLTTPPARRAGSPQMRQIEARILYLRHRLSQACRTEPAYHLLRAIAVSNATGLSQANSWTTNATRAHHHAFEGLRVPPKTATQGASGYSEKAL